MVSSSDRRSAILARVQRSGRVRSAELAGEFGVAEMTIRRDLNELHAAGLVSRVHGGALTRSRDAAPAGGVVTIGVLVPAREYYFSEIVSGASAAAEPLRARLRLGTLRHGIANGNPLAYLVDAGAEGLLVTPPADSSLDQVAAWLSGVRVPAVLMERSSPFPRVDEFDHVRSDHAYGARLAIEHLRRLGHRGIAVGVADTPTTPALLAEVDRQHALPGLPAGVHVFHLPPSSDAGLPTALTAMYERSRSAGIRAFFVHTDVHAVRFAHVVRERGVQVPGDVAIVAYDDVLAATCTPPLTAVAPAKREIGAAALELVVRRIRLPSADDPLVHTALLPRLVVRESCGAPATTPY